MGKKAVVLKEDQPGQVDLEELLGGTIAAHPKGKQLDKYGREVLSPVPIAPPVGYKQEPSIFDRVRDLVRSETLRHAAMGRGYETFEEADDFDVGDDYDPRSPYELQFDPPERQVPPSPPVPAGAGPAPAGGPATAGPGASATPVPAGEATPVPKAP